MGHMLYSLPLLVLVTYSVWGWWLVDVLDLPRAEHG
jgi:hypothetical protein